MLRTVCVRPLIRCTPKGNQLVARSRSACRRHPQHVAGPGAPPGAHVDAVRVPGLETAGPLTAGAHRAEDGVLAADMSDQFDGAVQQQPPEVGRPGLLEQHVVAVEFHHLADREQLGQLIVAEPVEQRDIAQIGRRRSGSS